MRQKKLHSLNYSKFLLFICLILSTFFAKAFAGITPLPVDEAFAARIVFDTPQSITTEFKIAPGYYLYAQRMHIAFDPALTTDIQYPIGINKNDIHRGKYPVYTGNFNIPIALPTSAQLITMTLDYQGCSERGFCYPPMQKKYQINLAQQQIIPVVKEIPVVSNDASTLKTLMTDQNRVNEILASQHIGMLLIIFTCLGFLMAFTPCVLPMIPILTSIIVGQKQAVDTKKALLLSTIYVLGSAITYAFAGVVAAMMGSSLQTYLEKPFVIALVSGLFLLLALSLFGVYDLHIPRRLQSKITAISRKQKGGTYVGVFIMGMVSSLIVSPCVTAPLVGVLMYIANSGNVVLGGSALFLLGIGMGVPLIVIGASAGKWLPRRGPWMLVIQKLFGLLMVGMAIWLLTRVHSLMIVAIFCGIILLAATIYFYAKQFNKSVVIAAGMTSAILIFGGVFATSLLQKATNSQTGTTLPGAFIVVRNTDELRKQLLLAQVANRPALVDFYADWCTSCVAMEKAVFDATKVQKVLSPFVLIRVDLSENNDSDEQLLKFYSVIAPPTVLFFNNQGKEIHSRRIIGEVNQEEFLGRLNSFFTASCDSKIQC